MKVVSPVQMNRIDSLCINEIGIPGMVLMENAALRIVEEVQKDLAAMGGRTVVVLCGKGNNGGDGFAAARHLHNRGVDVMVYLLAGKEEVKGDARTNLNILEAMGVLVTEVLHESLTQNFSGRLQAADLVLDGIFGTGFRGEIEENIKQVFQAVNASGKRILSIDIPSGVSGETGKAEGTCIKAHKTVTFALPKVGLVVHPGCEFAGELVIADIGIPKKVIDSMDININLLDDEYVSKLLPFRRNESNKGDYGKALIVTGSRGMTGAGCLCAKALLRTGAGLCYIGAPSSLISIYNTALLESVTVPLEDRGTGYLSKNSIPQILDRAKKMDVLAVGPGLSLNEEITEIVQQIIKDTEIPLVLDADALNAVSRDVSILGNLKAGAVLTPHPGEMARLAGISIADVQNNRIEAAREFSLRWKVNLVLKGARTIIACPDGTLYINPTGNPGMATGGTGDALTGVITALIAQGLSPEDAASAGVYIHGLAGDRAAIQKGCHGLIAGDVVEELPGAMKSLMKNNEC